MTLLTLAVKNLRYQAGHYAGVFVSSAFAVWLFYLYATLLFHPRLQEAKLPAVGVQVLLGVEVVVGIFSVFFIIYAHSAFRKARQKELGLLTLLGMRPGQIARLVHTENALIGLGAITAGVAAGTAGGFSMKRPPARLHPAALWALGLT